MPKLEGVIEFFVTATPSGLLELYASLADLKYPLSDMAAFHSAIDSRIAEESLDAEVGQVLEQMFSVADFPLASNQNALEKFNLRLPPSARIVRLPTEIAPQQIPIEPGGLEPPLDVTHQLPFHTTEVLRAYLRRRECKRRCQLKLESCLAQAGERQEAQLRCHARYLECTFSCR